MEGEGAYPGGLPGGKPKAKLSRGEASDGHMEPPSPPPLFLQVSQVSGSDDVSVGATPPTEQLSQMFPGHLKLPCYSFSPRHGVATTTLAFSYPGRMCPLPPQAGSAGVLTTQHAPAWPSIQDSGSICEGSSHPIQHIIQPVRPEPQPLRTDTGNTGKCPNTGAWAPDKLDVIL